MLVYFSKITCFNSEPREQCVQINCDPLPFIDRSELGHEKNLIDDQICVPSVTRAS